MERELGGIHHVTAIASDPQPNVDFYTGVLGLRLVKLTVNFDDPFTYHLYYGDETGSPGTLVTFFPWSGAPRGRVGAGQVTRVGFAIPEGSAGRWRDRLRAAGVAVDAGAADTGPGEAQEALRFEDPDGLPLELVEALPRGGSAIGRLSGIAMTVGDREPSRRMLAEHLGFKAVGSDRYRAGEQVVRLVADPGAARGLQAAGTNHHVAWRTPGDQAQLAWRERLVRLGHSVTPVRDRQYFHSIYFREPGGVLFEIATDPPGFTTDEPVAALGSGLRLPPWLEPQRSQIEERLPRLRPPAREAARS